MVPSERADGNDQLILLSWGNLKSRSSGTCSLFEVSLPVEASVSPYLKWV